MIKLEFENFEFNSDGHVYKLNGISIPSVSRVIQPVSMAEYGQIDPVVLGKAAEKGTKVHSAIENFNEFGVEVIEDELRPYFEAYKAWSEEVSPAVEASEIRFYHKYMRYAGTADMLAYIDGKLVLVDFKTSYKVVDRNYRLQLEAYKQALSTCGIDVERKIILHLKKNGDFDVVEYPIVDSEAWKIFCACKSIYDYTVR